MSKGLLLLAIEMVIGAALLSTFVVQVINVAWRIVI